jgi:hypothetical protein
MHSNKLGGLCTVTCRCTISTVLFIGKQCNLDERVEKINISGTCAFEQNHLLFCLFFSYFQKYVKLLVSYADWWAG